MANKRRKVTYNEKMTLLTEVAGKCPKCNKRLMGKNNNKQIVLFEVAHIYPLNATDHQKEIFSDEKKLSEDIDSIENMIPLCFDCHKIFDTDINVEDYRELYEIKKNILIRNDLIKSWNGQLLHQDISKVVEALSNLDEIDSNLTLSYTAVDINSKIDASLGNIYRSKVNSLITDFYLPVQNAFKNIEKEHSNSIMIIFLQIRQYYFMVSERENNQKIIFKEICEWLMHSASLNDFAKAEILVAFFIQNCEVFSSATSK